MSRPGMDAWNRARLDDLICLLYGLAFGVIFGCTAALVGR